jgi:integrase
VALLKAHKRAQAELRMKNRTSYQNFGLVFAKQPEDLQTPHAKLGQALTTLTEARFEALVKAAGVRRIKPHGLRHTSCTLALAAGVPVHVVAQRVGHSNAAMTLNVYAHALPDQQAAAAKALGDVLHGHG